MTKKMLVALAATVAFALPSIAQAGSNDFDVIVDGRTGAETRSLAVQLHDLNLASDRGYRIADSRLVRASKKVCGYMAGSIIPVQDDYRSCYGSAIDGARGDLDALAQAQRAG